MASLEVLDTPPEKAVDDLTALAAYLCAAPMAFVGLVDVDRQWVKSRLGVAFAEIPRDDAFCVDPCCNRDVVVVSDARLDCGFTHNPLMTAVPDLRFYARAPLMTVDGYVLGALCVLDTAPRRLTDLQRHHLNVVAAQVLSRLEIRRQTRVLRSVLEERSAALVALRAKQRILDGVLNHTDVLIYAKDLDGRFVLANPAVERATHAGSGELIGRTDHEVFAVQIADRYRSNDLHIIATRQWQVFVEDLVDPDGSTRAYRSTKFPLIADTGDVIGIGGVSTDVTELAAARTAHAESEQRWRALVEQSLVAVSVIGANGRILYANPQAAALCGAQSVSEIEGQPALSLIAPGTEESMQKMIEAILGGGPPLRAQQWRLQQVSGGQITVEFNATGINYLGGPAVQVEFRDITVAAAAHAALERIASTDPLTGLLNRRAWDAALQVLLDGGSCVPLVIAFIDLDRFKAYNDLRGHSAGDALLRDFASAARAALRDQDVLVRWGGEEFVVALPDTDAEQAARIFEQVRSSVPAGQTCSIGFTTWNPPEALNAALVRADQALYQAKRRGRDQVARG